MVTARNPGAHNFDPIAASTRLIGTATDNGSRRYDRADVSSAADAGLLGAVIAHARADNIVLDDDATVMLDALVHRCARQAVVLESRAASAVSLLRDTGIDTRVLKGAAVAHIDYADPALRQFGDIDLLIRGQDMSTAVQVFGDVGFSRHYVEPFDGFDERIGKGVAVEDDTGTVFDLHRTLALGYFGTRLPVEELWNDPAAFEVAGVEMSTLPRVQRFVHCALHMALAPTPRIANAVDLCVIGGGLEPLATVNIVEVAERWGCQMPLALAVGSTDALFEDAWAPEGLIEWARTLRTPLSNRLAMAAFQGPVASSRLRSLTSIAGLRSNAMRLRALRGLITQGHHERD